jgi:hypothetical protein
MERMDGISQTKTSDSRRELERRVQKLKMVGNATTPRVAILRRESGTSLDSKLAV